MQFVSYRVDGGIVGCPRQDEVVRRRHQGDGHNLAVLFGERHKGRRRAPLLARDKPVEQPQDQAMLSLAS